MPGMNILKSSCNAALILEETPPENDSEQTNTLFPCDKNVVIFRTLFSYVSLD